MAGVAPEPPVEHLAPVGRIAPELAKLPVPARLEGEADGPHNDGQPIQQAERGRFRADLGRQEWRGDNPQQHALQEKDLEEAAPPPARAVLGAPGRVAEVLRLADVAAADVQRKTQAPQGDQGQDQQLARGGAVGGQGGIHQRDDHEARPPENIDDTRILDRQAEQPDQRDGDQNRQQAGKIDVEKVHGVSPERADF
jgi:hypothetical protein